MLIKVSKQYVTVAFLRVRCVNCSVWIKKFMYVLSTWVRVLSENPIVSQLQEDLHLVISSLPAASVLSHMNAVLILTRFPKMWFSIVLPCVQRSSDGSLVFRLSDQNHAPIFHHLCLMASSQVCMQLFFSVRDCCVHQYYKHFVNFHSVNRNPNGYRFTYFGLNSTLTNSLFTQV
jgi:hypothetical protein